VEFFAKSGILRAVWLPVRYNEYRLERWGGKTVKELRVIKKT